ncbi:hypothetical protein [Fodinibius sp. SL11]|uniref:hypothetical protein n=1 Tax=Fodinibius sp. SL11 TaxID=3425690 RepID=UPI003F883008
MFSSQSTQAQGLGINAGGNFAHFNDVDGAADSRTGLIGHRLPRKYAERRPIHVSTAQKKRPIASFAIV